MTRETTPPAEPARGPTLLELLESTAQGHENLCELGLLPRQHHPEAKAIATRLRAAAARLRSEMANADMGRQNAVSAIELGAWNCTASVLTRINGGPIEPTKEPR